MLSDHSRDRERLIDSLGPASLLVAIERRMSAELCARLRAEVLLQDTLLHLWRDRARIEWCGARAFRTPVLSMAGNRIGDAADHAFASKRGGHRAQVSTNPFPSDGSRSSAAALPAASTTPSRVAIRCKQADAVREALSGLSDEPMEIVRLRAFEQMPLEEIARRMGLGDPRCATASARGSALYACRLRSMLETGTSTPKSCDGPTLERLFLRCATRRRSTPEPGPLDHESDKAFLERAFELAVERLQEGASVSVGGAARRSRATSGASGAVDPRRAHHGLHP